MAEVDLGQALDWEGIVSTMVHHMNCLMLAIIPSA